MVDTVLQQMEGFSRWEVDSDAERTDQLPSGLVQIQEMLPAAVARRFKFGNLCIAGAHFSRSQDCRCDLISEIATSLKAGPEAAADDPAPNRGRNPDLSDRPKSGGGEIREALAQFEKDRDRSALSRLQLAASPTRLQPRANTMEMLTSRKRPCGNQFPELAMLNELHRLECEARACHGHKA